jgi:peptide/nickel transport system permease protein
VLRYLARRLPRYLVVLAVVNAVAFLATAYLGLRQESAHRFASYGGTVREVPDPEAQVVVPVADVLASYGRYALGVFTGDLGDLRERVPLAAYLVGAVPKSLLLLALALTVAGVGGVAVGYLSVDRVRARTNPLALGMSLVGFSMPAFYLGVVAIQAMFLYSRAVGQRGTPLPASGFGLDAHLVLPVLVLSVRPMAEIARFTAELLADELGKPYIRTAHAKGLSWRLVLLRHAFPNIAAGVVATLGNSLRYLISSLVVVEVLFDWPGLGETLAHALTPRMDGRPSDYQQYDPPVVAGLVTALAALSLSVNLAAGLAAQALDPRLRRAAGP